MQEPIIYFAWEVEALEVEKRSKVWWTVTILVVLGLFGYALISANFAFAVMLVMLIVVFVLIQQRQEKMHQVVVADQGILVNTTLFPYRNIREFFIAEDLGHLYLTLNRAFGSCVHVGISPDVDLGELRMTLREHAVENAAKHEEPLIDLIARKLKLF
ncbi:MAG: hypothetical protein V1821_04335 [bacterium]